MERHTVNEDFFKTWTRESAWVYGWLLTDGYVEEKSGQIRLSLKKTDRDVVEKVKHAMNFSGPVYDSELNDGRLSSYVRVCRKGMVEDIFSLGMARKEKTFNTSMPNIPDYLFWDLVRGIFEGDGNLKHGIRWNDLTITIASATETFLFALQTELEKFGIYTRLKYNPPGKSGRKHPLYTLITKSNADALRWCFFMYAHTNESLRMNRKFNVYTNYVRGYYDRKRRSASCGELVELAYQIIPEITEMDVIGKCPSYVPAV